VTLTSTMTEVAAGEIILSSGHVRKLFTATTTAGGQAHTFLEFETIYYVRAWDQGDGTDGEAFVTSADYTAPVTVTQDKGAVYVEVVGKSIRSTGGAT